MRSYFTKNFVWSFNLKTINNAFPHMTLLIALKKRYLAPFVRVPHMSLIVIHWFIFNIFYFYFLKFDIVYVFSCCKKKIIDTFALVFLKTFFIVRQRQVPHQAHVALPAEEQRIEKIAKSNCAPLIAIEFLCEETEAVIINHIRSKRKNEWDKYEKHILITSARFP